MWAINWASLSFASYLLFWLSILGTALYVGLMLGINAVETLSMRYGSGGSLSTLLDSKMKNAKARRLVNKWTPRIGMLILGYVFGQAQLFNPVRELHNVTVLQDNGDRKFTVGIPAKGNPIYKSNVEEVWKLCGDPLPLKAGMVMIVFQYRQGKDCLLIDSGTEVKFLNDAQGNVIDQHGDILFAKGE